MLIQKTFKWTSISEIDRLRLLVQESSENTEYVRCGSLWEKECFTIFSLGTLVLSTTSF